MSQPTTQTQRPETDFSKLDTVTISLNRPAKWYMYIVKKVLKERGTVNIRARPSAAGQAVRVAEALNRLKYIEYTGYQTTTLESLNKNLVRFFIISVKKTKDFDRLFDERETERKKLLEGEQAQKK